MLALLGRGVSGCGVCRKRCRGRCTRRDDPRRSKNPKKFPLPQSYNTSWTRLHSFGRHLNNLGRGLASSRTLPPRSSAQHRLQVRARLTIKLRRGCWYSCPMTADRKKTCLLNANRCSSLGSTSYARKALAAWSRT